MKRFIIRCFVFLVLLLILAMTADYWLSYRGRESEMRNLKLWNEWYGKTDNYDIVIGGNSRAMTSFNPAIIDAILGANSFNLGINGSQINRQVIKYNIYRRTHPAPKLFIQGIDHYLLNITRGYVVEQFYPYWSDKELINMVNEYEHFSLAELYLPFYRYIGDPKYIRRLVTGEIVDGEVNKGFRPYDYSWDRSAIDSIIDRGGMLYTYDKDAVNILSQFIARLQKDGTTVVLVHAPVYKDTYGEMIKGIDQMWKLYDSIAKRHNTIILDYSEISFCDDTTCFYNATHMTTKGANLFTNRLAHDLDSLGLYRRQ